MDPFNEEEKLEKEEIRRREREDDPLATSVSCSTSSK
jgi:hypothetical protein